jgi:peptidoglycan/LPS O-acetylase OafA/YrhL
MSGAVASLSIPVPPPKNAASGYRPELDVLRFLCFLLVLFHHTAGEMVGHLHGTAARWGAASVAASGFGTDLFFVLSSFLITTLLLRELKLTGTLNTRFFYARRILRLWPLYFVAVFVILLLQQLQPPAERLQPVHIVALLLFTGNWALGLWPVATFAAPLWSLSMQEQFYLVWAWAVRRARLPVLVASCLSAIVAGFIFRLWAIHSNTSWQFLHCATFSVLDAFALGALIAIALRGRLPDLPSSARVSLVIACLAGWVWICFPAAGQAARTEFELKLWYPITALGSAGILISALGVRGAIADVILHCKPLLHLGRISYGLYIWHPIATFALNRAGLSTWLRDSGMRRLHNREIWAWFATELLLFAATLILASASYRWLESPCLKLKSRFAPNKRLILELKKEAVRIDRTVACQDAAG